MHTVKSLRKIRTEVSGLWSLVVGLRVTGGLFLKDQVTVHYPRQGVDNIESFRGPIELVESPDDPGRPRCIACMTCVSACPHGCIDVVKKRPPKVEEQVTKGEGPNQSEGEKKVTKGPGRFVYDYTRCCLCGLCVENCPVHSIRFSNRAYLAGVDKNDFLFDLLGRFSGKGENGDKDTEKRMVGT